MLEAERSKVVVVGDSGVGKTALVHLLCKEQPLCNPSYTVGCGLEVKMHLFRGDMGSEKPFFIELWDVGGCNAHANTRSVFYHAVHGLILVYDCTNRKSQLNLRKWLWEVIRQNPNWSSDSVASLGSSASGKVSNLFSSWSLLDVASNVGLRYLDNKCDDVYAKSNHSSALPFPVLVVGTKIDLLDSTTRLQITKRTGEGSNGTACNVPHGSAFSSNHHQVDTQDASSVLMRPHVNDAARQPRTGSVYVNLSGISPSSLLKGSSRKTEHLALEMGFPEILLCCNSASYIAPNSWNAVLLDRFFDDVVQTRLSGISSHGNNSPDTLRIRRFGPSAVDEPDVMSGLTFRPIDANVGRPRPRW